MTINEMKNAIINDFGFEDYRTISFFQICENWSDNYEMIKTGYEMCYYLT